MPGRLEAGGAFTLLEVLVVLIVLGLSAALVAPAFVVPGDAPRVTLAHVLAESQGVALRRGEVLTLRVTPEGAWSLMGSSRLESEPIVVGRLKGDAPEAPLVLRVAPGGSCAPDLETALPPGLAARLDLLSCRLVDP